MENWYTRLAYIALFDAMPGLTDRTKIGDGTMPLVGFGTYLLSDEQCEVSVKAALKLGYIVSSTKQRFWPNALTPVHG